MTFISTDIDRLSSLPEDILGHLLSLIPTNFAMRTSILSKRWRYRWTLIHNLDFDEIYHVQGKDCFLKFVNRALELRKSSQIQIFRIHSPKFFIPSSVLFSWIDVAISLHVRELDIQVNNLYEFNCLPMSIFTCKTLTKFRFDLRMLDYPDDDLLSFVNLPNLRTLNLIVYSKSFDYAFKIINGCPILENLSLEIKQRCDNDDYCFSIPTLKQFKLKIKRSITSINRIVLNVPDLEYLFVKGSFMYSRFIMEDLSSLVKAKVSCNGVHDYHLWVELLNGISGAKSISLSLKSSCTSNNIIRLSPLVVFPNLKQLEIKGYTDAKWMLILHVLRMSPELEHLCTEKLKQMPYCRSYMTEPYSVPACMLTNLKTMKYTITKREKFDMQIHKFMLANSKVLKMLKVNFDTDLSSEVKDWFFATLTMLPRASRDCQIRFVGA